MSGKQGVLKAKNGLFIAANGFLLPGNEQQSSGGEDKVYFGKTLPEVEISEKPYKDIKKK